MRETWFLSAPTEARVVSAGAKRNTTKTPRRIVNEHVSVQRGPRPSDQSCGLPSIWISSPNARPPLAQLEHPLVTPPLRLP